MLTSILCLLFLFAVGVSFGMAIYSDVKKDDETSMKMWLINTGVSGVLFVAAIVSPVLTLISFLLLIMGGIVTGVGLLARKFRKNGNLTFEDIMQFPFLALTWVGQLLVLARDFFDDRSEQWQQFKKREVLRRD